MSLVAFEGGQYSVPHRLAGQVVHVRRHGEQVVIAHAGPQGPAEVALNVPAGRPLAGVHYDVCLAVDHIDFPTPVRGAR